MPPSRETRECPYCAEVILAKAIKCRHCGEMLDGLPCSVADDDEVDSPDPARRLWSPGVAALLSLLIPGAGQMYRGQVGAGLLWLVCVPLGYVLVVPGLILHVICIFNAASGDPTARRRESARVAVCYAFAALSLACVAGAIIYLALRQQSPINRQLDQQPLAFIPPSPTPQENAPEQTDATPTPSPSVEPTAQPSVEPSVEAVAEPSSSTPAPSSESASSSITVANNLPPPPAGTARQIPVTDILHSAARLNVEAGKPSPQQRYQAGVELLRQQRWAEAEAELREAVRLKADNPYYHFHLGAALSPQMRFAETEAEFREAARLDPSNALWRAKLAYILSVRKKWAEAEQEAREASRLDSSNVGYKTLLQNIQQKK